MYVCITLVFPHPLRCSTTLLSNGVVWTNDSSSFDIRFESGKGKIVALTTVPRDLVSSRHNGSSPGINCGRCSRAQTISPYQAGRERDQPLVIRS